MNGPFSYGGALGVFSWGQHKAVLVVIVIVHPRVSMFNELPVFGVEPFDKLSKVHQLTSPRSIRDLLSVFSYFLNHYDNTNIINQYVR